MHDAGGDRPQTVAALIVGVLVLAVACGEALPATTGAAPTASSAPVAAPAIGGNVAWRRPVDPRPLYTPGGGCRVASPSTGVPS